MAGAATADPSARLAVLDPAAYPVTRGALASGAGVRGYPELLDYWLGLMLADLTANQKPARLQPPVAREPDASSSSS